MSDIIDRANEQMQYEMNRSLANVKRFDTPSLTECADCGEDIPLQRQRLGSVTRCIDCQSRFERRR